MRQMRLVGIVVVAAGLLLSAPAQGALQLYYDFEEGSGATLNDGSGNTRTGTYQNLGGSSWVAGEVGSWAIDLNGSNQWVQTVNSLASQMNMEGNKPKTVAAWAYTRSSSDRGMFDLGAAGSAGRHFNLRTRGNGNDWRAQFWGSADFDFTVASQDTWGHFALVHDGTQGIAYFNGTPVASKGSTLVVDDGRAFEIGRYNGGGYFNGIVDEMVVYDEALAYNQIAHLAGKGDPTNLPAGPMAWDFGATPNIQDWTVLNGEAHFRSGDGDGLTPGDGSGGFAHDGGHETLLAESPEFVFTGDTLDGTNVMIVGSAGGAGHQGGSTVAPFNTPADVLAHNGGNANSDGLKALAFFNTATGQYDATLFNQNDGGTDMDSLTAADLTALGVDLGATYRLHFYENDQGGWGWGQLNSVQLAAGQPGEIPEPATMVLAALGVMGLGGYVRRRRHAG